MNIIDIAIAKQLAGGGGGSGTDSYNDLSNLPKINDVTLSGNKSSSALGLQSEITSDSKLASDLVDDTNQDNKFVTSAEKTTWNGKQNAIDADHKINADYVDDSTSTNKFVTASDKETWNAKQNAIDNSHKLSSDLVDDANHTNKFVTSTEKQTWNAKQNAIDADHKLSSSLVSFSEAEAAAIASGIDSSKVGQISTNQTNILYNLNMGVKNKIPYRTSPHAVSDTGITVSIDDDNTYKITGTKTISDSYIELDDIISSELAGDHVASISVSGTGDCQIAAYGYNGSTWTLMLTTSTAQGFSVGSYTIIKFRIRFTGSINSSYNAIVKPMVCKMEAWNQSHDWQPPALPNYDLTRLESEDRAGLIECVDGGAKNKVNIVSPTATIGNITFTHNSDGSITVNGTANNTDTFYYLTSTTGNSGQSAVMNVGSNPCILTGCPSGGAGNTYELQLATNSGDYRDRGTGIDIPANSSGSVVIAIRAGYAPSNLKFYPMICTKAAFGVSQKFVPYRPSYDTIASTYLTKCNTAVVNSGSLDDVSTNTIAYYSNNVSGMPSSVSGYAICETTVFDANVMVQKLYMIDGVYNAFIRMKQTGTWRAWKQITNT